jgi:putative membrane protein
LGCAALRKREYQRIGPLEFIVILVIFALPIGLVGLVLWAVRRTSSGRAGGPRTAKEVLQMRYARGEITREQYQQMEKDLEG